MECITDPGVFIFTAPGVCITDPGACINAPGVSIVSPGVCISAAVICFPANKLKGLVTFRTTEKGTAISIEGGSYPKTLLYLTRIKQI